MTIRDVTIKTPGGNGTGYVNDVMPEALRIWGFEKNRVEIRV